MNIKKAILPLLLLTGWVALLSYPFGTLPPIGQFFNPQSGFWANALKVGLPENDFKPYKKDDVLDRVQIVFDERLVPHIKAENDYDLYYAQGYVQAYYRLWQMDMQTRATSGRISEIIGEKGIGFDRRQRRKGMYWAAEKTLETIMKDKKTAEVFEAYANGINAFIHSLNYKNLPLEYKLMNFEPEEWETINTLLLVKAMADDLTGQSYDIPLSYVRQSLSQEEFDFLYPDKLAESKPVIPRGTIFSSPSLNRPDISGEELFYPMPTPKASAAQVVYDYPSNIGSNNWVLAAEKSKSGNPVLANDPHLSLTLPSIWFEVQLTAPGINCYGVSIPGSPGVIIGFNDSISWGLTNNYRDVKDYYALKLDATGEQYLFDGTMKSFEKRMENITVKGWEKDFVDTVLYSVHGPVEYQPSFPDASDSRLHLAMTWAAHQVSNEGMAIYKLNRAQNYSDFTNAIHRFEVPGQNFIYADNKHNIAIWGQGRFVNKWKEQGRFVMRGDTSATLWAENIPMNENPHSLNPEQHYLQSANQQVTDETFPYYYNGDFSEIRSWAITRFLEREEPFSISEMQALQNNNWSYLANQLMPLFYEYGTEFAKEFPDYAAPWNDSLNAETKTGAAFQIWWKTLFKNVWEEKFKDLPAVVYPSRERTLDLIVNHPLKLQEITGKPLSEVIDKSFKTTADSLRNMLAARKEYWCQIQNASVVHLANIEPFGFYDLRTGGSAHSINAMEGSHGPSWRMIVEMRKEGVQALGAYPGGQSGNPGSPYYNNFLDRWTRGNYFKIHFLNENEYSTFSNKN